MNFISLVGILSVAGSMMISIWAVFKYVLLGSYRLDNDSSKRIIEMIEREAEFSWILTGEYVNEPKFPDTYEAIVKLRGMYFYFTRNERLMTAGWKGKEELTFITFARWNRKRVIGLLSRGGNNSDTVPVMALTPNGSDRLGELKCDSHVETFLDKKLYEDIERDVVNVLEKRTLKTSCLLHGSPGNGKTQFVKYLARKYSLPINVIYLRPDYGNLDIALMFASIPPRSIVLLEDFDNSFNKRECSMKNDQVNFTFDAIINALDGIHNDYKGNVFVMTANDIDRIDDSIKNRPSRFKFVREFGPPTREVRMKILKDEKLVEATEGQSLDKVFQQINS